MNTGSFSQQIAQFGETTKKRIEQIRRGVTLKLFSDVIEDTPVGSDYKDKDGNVIKHIGGRLRANWQCSLENPDYTTTDEKDANNTSTKAKAENVIKQSSGDTKVFLSNSLPYAHRIEYDGWSKNKAPEGMVRKNVVRFQGLVKVQAEKAKDTK